MSLTLLLYLGNIVESMSVLFGVLSLVVAIFAISSILEGEKNTAKSLVITSITLFTIAAFIPSKAVVYAYGAETVIRDISANPRIQALYDKSLKLLEDKLDSLTKDTHKKE